MSQHYLTYATNTRAVCGADMVGRRNSRKDTDTVATTCRECLAWLGRNARGDSPAESPEDGSNYHG